MGEGCSLECFECGTTVAAADVGALGDAFLAHARSAHQWPFPDQGVRNYAEATQRLTGPGDRLPAIGDVEVHAVTEDRLDDWLAFFDHDGFVGAPEWASCYCLEPHLPPGRDESEPEHWRAARATMVDRLRTGESFGYLAYVDGRAGGWVNASRRADEALHARGPDADPPDDEVVGVACFVIAPPYRRHGLAGALLDRVVADAPGRGARWVEAYPFHSAVEALGAKDFRGPRSLYDARGFVEVAERERDHVVRLGVGS
jgi:GNAT superfamily N-acetyltransferase